jgi:hypothetical protein
MLRAIRVLCSSSSSSHTRRFVHSPKIKPSEPMFWALLCSSFSKIDCARAKWCGALLLSSLWCGFENVFRVRPIFWTLLLHFRKLTTSEPMVRRSPLLSSGISENHFRIHPMFWTLYHASSYNVENSRPPSPWWGALLLLSFDILGKKLFGYARCSVLSSPLAIYPRKLEMPGLHGRFYSSLLLLPFSKTNRVCPHVLWSRPFSLYDLRKPKMPELHVLCSPLFLKNVQDYKRICTPFTRKKESKIDSR